MLLIVAEPKNNPLILSKPDLEARGLCRGPDS